MEDLGGTKPPPISDGLFEIIGHAGIPLAQQASLPPRPPPVLLAPSPLPTSRSSRAIEHDLRATDVVVVAAGDAVETLRLVRRCGLEPTVVMLDPPYHPEDGQPVAAFRRWLRMLMRAATRVADHVFLWGEPTTLAALVARVPQSHELRAWITWAIPNAVTKAKGWRPGHQMCLHLARSNAKMHVENFYNDAQARLARDRRLIYQPSPTTVIDAALVSSSHRRHPHEKPGDVIRRLLLMTTTESALVVDPCCGSGSTGEVARELGRLALLCDVSEAVVGGVASRIGGTGRSASRYPAVNLSKSVATPQELEDRRRCAVEACRKGEAQAAVARRLGVSREGVRRWVEASKEGRLAAKARRGRKSKLSHEQLEHLRELIAINPGGWSGPKLAARIMEDFGIPLHVDTALRLLRRLRPELQG